MEENFWKCAGASPSACDIAGAMAVESRTGRPHASELTHVLCKGADAVHLPDNDANAFVFLGSTHLGSRKHEGVRSHVRFAHACPNSVRP